MYIQLWHHMHMGMGRCMHVCMYITNMTSHFRMATQLSSIHVMVDPMSGKATLSGPFISPLLTLQPLKLALKVLYEVVRSCHLIVQGGQAFPSGHDRRCQAITICGGGHRSQDGLTWHHRRSCHEGYAIRYVLPKL